MPLYELEGVSHTYPDGSASLRDITLRIDDGARIAIVGPNGAGKSTLLWMLDLLIRPATGTIAFRGREISAAVLASASFTADFRRSVAMVFQNSEAQLFSATVRDEIGFGPSHYAAAAEVAARVDQIARRLNLAHLLARSPLRLSAGEQKRIALACALATSPSVLLLDEPTAGLDPRSLRSLLEILRDEQKAGTTIITATHDIHLVWEISDRVIMLGEDKRIVADGPTETIMADRDLLERNNLFHEHIHRHGDRWHSHGHEHSE